MIYLLLNDKLILKRNIDRTMPGVKSNRYILWKIEADDFNFNDFQRLQISWLITSS